MQWFTVDGRKGLHLVASHEHSCRASKTGPPQSCLFPTSCGEFAEQCPFKGPHIVRSLYLCCWLLGSHFWILFPVEGGAGITVNISSPALKSVLIKLSRRKKKKNYSGEPSGQYLLLWFLESVSFFFKSADKVFPGHHQVLWELPPVWSCISFQLHLPPHPS